MLEGAKLIGAGAATIALAGAAIGIGFNSFSCDKSIISETVIRLCYLRLRTYRSNCLVRINDGIPNLILKFDSPESDDDGVKWDPYSTLMPQESESEEESNSESDSNKEEKDELFNEIKETVSSLFENARAGVMRDVMADMIGNRSTRQLREIKEELEQQGKESTFFEEVKKRKEELDSIEDEFPSDEE